tara:strand:- start:9983 stop:10222 length:240 start_codon:yes stop_codon:yes gene_type:complete
MKKIDLYNLIKKSLLYKGKIDDKSSQKNVSEWDSLGHLSIITALDKATKGKTSKIKSLAEANSAKKIFDILKKNKIIKN